MYDKLRRLYWWPKMRAEDYLTKWVEAFATSNQQSETIAHLLAETYIVCRHGAPEEVLSDRGSNFLPNVILELYCVLGMKINTTEYHPQTWACREVQFNNPR